MISRLTALVALLSCLLFGSCAEGNASLEQALIEIKSSQIAPLLPRKAYLEQSALGHVLLAPDGKSVVYQILQERSHEIWVYEIASQTRKKLISVKSLEEFHWSANSQHIYYMASNKLFWLDAHKSNHAKQLYDFSNPNVEFMRPDKHMPDLLWMNRYIPGTQEHQLIKITLDGTENVVFSSKHALTGFRAHEGEVVIVQYWVDDQIHIAKLSETSTDILMRCNSIEPCHALHWDAENQSLLLTTYADEDVMGLYRLDVDTNKLELVHQDPDKRFDINRVLFDADGNVTFTSYTTDFRENYPRSSKAENVLARINEKLDSQIMHLTASESQDVWLIIDDDPRLVSTMVYIYNSTIDNWQTPFVELVQAKQFTKSVAPRVPIWYTASDSMKLQGYVTLPLGYEINKVPLVVSPHGGPWNRSIGNPNRHAQFLANRGYAVFEPNFRASTGFGRNYLFSANKDFGDGRVQKDIIEGVEYLLSLGIGDPNQLAIAGHSFGGFSALNALAFTPDMFQVAFAGAAPSNLSNTIMRYAKKMTPLMTQRNMPRFRTLMVNIDDSEDVKRLYEQSPDKNWQSIKRPLYLWAGEKDKRVAVEDIRSIATRLKNAGNPIVLLSDPREGHSPSGELAREAYLYMLETALAKYVKGRVDDTKSEILIRYLSRNVLIDAADFLREEK